MIPLAMADPNVDLTVRRIAGNPDLRQHLETLGFVTGAIVRVVAENSGNVIVNVKESRVAINDEMARRIMI